MMSFLLVLFSVAWAVVAFAAIWSLFVVWGFHRRVAVATAFAVAAAFVLGAASPFALSKRVAASAPPAPTALVPHITTCPADAKVSKVAGSGHIDLSYVAGASRDLSKPIELPASSAIRLVGWALTSAGPAAELCVILDGRVTSFAGLYGVDRPDVAKAVGKPQDEASGFDVAVDIPVGSHVVGVGPLQADGTVTPLAQLLRVRVR